MSERMDTKARRLVDLKEKMEQDSIAADASAKAYRQAEADFWQSLKDSEQGDQKSFTSDLGPGYGTIQLARRETITSTIYDKTKAEEALKEMGLDDACLAETHEIRKAPLNQHVRDWIKSGQPLPAGVDFHAKRYIQVTRKKD